jgi:hypothetical protein
VREDKIDVSFKAFEKTLSHAKGPAPVVPPPPPRQGGRFGSKPWQNRSGQHQAHAPQAAASPAASPAAAPAAPSAPSAPEGSAASAGAPDSTSQH